MSDRPTAREISKEATEFRDAAVAEADWVASKSAKLIMQLSAHVADQEERIERLEQCESVRQQTRIGRKLEIPEFFFTRSGIMTHDTIVTEAERARIRKAVEEISLDVGLSGHHHDGAEIFRTQILAILDLPDTSEATPQDAKDDPASDYRRGREDERREILETDFAALIPWGWADNGTKSEFDYEETNTAIRAAISARRNG